MRAHVLCDQLNKWKKLTRDGQLALALQESSIGSDELLRLITEKRPISKYSVVRSLATPSRLLLDPSKNFFLHIYATLIHNYVCSWSEAQAAGFSQCHCIQINSSRCGSSEPDHNIVASEVSRIIFLVSSGPSCEIVER